MVRVLGGFRIQGVGFRGGWVALGEFGGWGSKEAVSVLFLKISSWFRVQGLGCTV